MREHVSNVPVALFHTGPVIWIPCRSSTRDQNWTFLVATKEICYLGTSCSSPSCRNGLGSHNCLQITSVKKVLLNIQKPLWNQKILLLLVHISATVFSKDDLEAGQGLSQKHEEKIVWEEGVSASFMFKWDHVSIPHTIKRAVRDYWAQYDPWVYGETFRSQHSQQDIHLLVKQRKNPTINKNLNSVASVTDIKFKK